jgi:hypothetical protein
MEAAGGGAPGGSGEGFREEGGYKTDPKNEGKAIPLKKSIVRTEAIGI